MGRPTVPRPPLTTIRIETSYVPAPWPTAAYTRTVIDPRPHAWTNVWGARRVSATTQNLDLDGVDLPTRCVSALRVSCRGTTAAPTQVVLPFISGGRKVAVRTLRARGLVLFVF